MEGTIFLSIVSFGLLSSAPKLYSGINAFILDSDVPCGYFWSTLWPSLGSLKGQDSNSRGIASPEGGVLCEQWPRGQISWEVPGFQSAVAEAKSIDTFGTCSFQNHMQFAMMPYHKILRVSWHSTLLQRWCEQVYSDTYIIRHISYITRMKTRKEMVDKNHAVRSGCLVWSTVLILSFLVVKGKRQTQPV